MNPNGRRRWPCTAGHRHETKRAAVFCQAEILINLLPAVRPAWVPSAQRVRAHFRRIPADERDDMPRVPVGKFDGRRFVSVMVWGLIGTVAALGSLAAIIAVGVGLMVLGARAVQSGHEWVAGFGLALLMLAPLAVAAAQVPPIRAAMVRLKDLYSD